MAYATIRVGSAAIDLWEQVRRALADASPQALRQAPSSEAFVYRQLRQELELQPRSGALPADASRYWRPTSSRYAAQLQAFRESCEPDLAEVLELRFARLLEPVEVAYVVGRPEAAVRAQLAEGVRFAAAQFGAAPPSCSNDVNGAIQEAFSLPAEPVPCEAEMLAAGTVIGDRYEIEAALGEGAFAHVYRARDRLVPSHVVALKLVWSEVVGTDGRESSLRELRHIASVFHPSVVQLKDYGWHEGWLWFVMPFYEGETLAERIEREPIGREEALSIFTALADGLAALHDAGIRHQDVKPENILLAKLGSTGPASREAGTLPVLIDLGVAARDSESLFAGTPEYFAPEVSACFLDPTQELEISGKADVFSLALCLRDALDPEAREALEGPELKAFVKRRASQPPALPSRRELRDLRPFFERWLAVEPERRPTVHEFIDELDVLARPARRRKRTRDLLRWLVPVGLVSAVLLGAGGYTLRAEANRQREVAQYAAQVASLQQERAERAARRAERAEESLELGEEERRALATEMESLADRYREGDLSRQELAARLAQSEAAHQAILDRVNLARAANARLREQNQDLAALATSSRDEVTQLRRALAEARRGPESPPRNTKSSPPPSPF